MQAIKIALRFIFRGILLVVAWQGFFWALSSSWQLAVLFLIACGIVWVLISPKNQAEPGGGTEESAEEKSEEHVDSTGIALMGFAAFASLAKGLSSLDDVPQIGGDSSTSSAGSRNWRDSEGKQIQVGVDGRIFYNGKFIGHRDANGRIVDGSGGMIGTLKDSGEYYDSAGNFKGRVFS